MAESLKDIATALKNAESILIIAHTQPDGDTLGSCYALHNALSAANYKSAVCCDSPVPEKYQPLIDGSILHVPNDINEKYDVAICLDCADKSRMGKSYKLFKKYENTINIDHHVSNDAFAKINYVKEASSVGEIIYELLDEMKLEVNSKTAEYLYIAISTDTGNFTYSNTSENCMAISSRLIEKFDLRSTAEILFRRRSLVSTQLIGRAISRLEMHSEGKIAVMSLLKSDLKELGADGSDCDNIVNYAREIDTVLAAVMIREIDNGVKVSLRSKGDVDVCSVAAAFGGGGHKNAAGCRIGKKIEKAKEELLEKLAELV